MGAMPEQRLRLALDRLCSSVAPSRESVSDARLLERFVDANDELAFELLVRRHAPMVLHVCRRVVRDVHLAEDAFQATFLVLVRKARSVAALHSVGGWLHRVAYHAALKLRARVARG